MVAIRRTSLLRRRYEVSADGGPTIEWHGRARRGGVETDEIDGSLVAVRPEGRKRFVLSRDGAEIGAARRHRRIWELTVEGRAYELRRRSMWRSARELRRPDGSVAGSVTRARGGRSLVSVEVDDDLSPLAQMFIGFVVIVLWDREAQDAAAGASAAGVAASGS
jgi:hypothetical protein